MSHIGGSSRSALSAILSYSPSTKHQLGIKTGGANAADLAAVTQEETATAEELTAKLEEFSAEVAADEAELKKASTGSCMVYCHPRLYFLGGEKNWYLHWFDLETNRWGVETGVPPTRLLSGGCVLDQSLYLVGGVTLDQWEGVAGGAGSVNTSSAMDR